MFGDLESDGPLTTMFGDTESDGLPTVAGKAIQELHDRLLSLTRKQAIEGIWSHSAAAIARLETEPTEPIVAHPPDVTETVLAHIFKKYPESKEMIKKIDSDDADVLSSQLETFFWLAEDCPKKWQGFDNTSFDSYTAYIDSNVKSAIQSYEARKMFNTSASSKEPSDLTRAALDKEFEIISKLLAICSWEDPNFDNFIQGSLTELKEEISTINEAMERYPNSDIGTLARTYRDHVSKAHELFASYAKSNNYVGKSENE